jgi:DNA polymerase elongation subunit (family B)
VATRCFGLFYDGAIKTRGIACCRRGIPPFIKEAQPDLLLVMGQAVNRKVLEGKLPKILDHLGNYVSRLKEGRVNTKELVLTRRIDKTLKEYRGDTPSALAL